MGRYCDILYREKIMAASFAAFVVFAIAASLNIVSSQEPAKCAIFNSCSSCLVFKECGWCASTGLCMTGSNLGPSGGNCTVWDFGICSVSPAPAMEIAIPALKILSVAGAKIPFPACLAPQWAQQEEPVHGRHTTITPAVFLVLWMLVSQLIRTHDFRLSKCCTESW